MSNKIIGTIGGMKLAFVILLLFAMNHFLFKVFDLTFFPILIATIYFFWKNKFIVINDQEVSIYIFFIRLKSISINEIHKVEIETNSDAGAFFVGITFYSNDRAFTYISNFTKNERNKIVEEFRLKDIEITLDE